MPSSEKALADRRRQAEIIAIYDREAHKVIHSFIEAYDIEDYEVTEFSVRCISSFLQEWHFYKPQLAEGVWTRVIKMYMKLDKIDWDFLEDVHAQMCRTH